MISEKSERIYCPIFQRKLEQAGIGQWPNSLAVCATNGVLSILRECFGPTMITLNAFLEFPTEFRY